MKLLKQRNIRWGLGYMMNLQAGPNGRSAGTFSWGNTKAVKLSGQFEASVYETL